MFDISAQVHDLIFAIGAAILFLAMLPAVWKKSIMPSSTCWITGGVLLIFTLNYVSMKYWYAMVVEAGNVACWFYLFWLTWRDRANVETKPNTGE